LVEENGQVVSRPRRRGALDVTPWDAGIAPAADRMVCLLRRVAVVLDRGGR
jgi:hypothetical protein